MQALQASPTMPACVVNKVYNFDPDSEWPVSGIFNFIMYYRNGYSSYDENLSSVATGKGPWK